MTPPKFIAPRFAPYASSLLMSSIMALVMATVQNLANNGPNPLFAAHLWHSYRIGMPTAFLCVITLRPPVTRFIQQFVRQETANK